MKVLSCVLCLALIVTVLSCSLSVFADDNPEPSAEPTDPPYGTSIAIREDLVAYYIWAMLNTWGIKISINNSFEFVSETRDQIMDWVMDYLALLPSSYDLSTWIAPWQAGYDYWGNLQGNSSMLEDIEEFAAWLMELLGLNDNDVHVVNPIYTLSGYQLYQPNTWYLADRGYNKPVSYLYVEAETYDSSGNSQINNIYPDYFFCWDDGTHIQLVFIKSSAWGCRLRVRLSNNTVDIAQQGAVSKQSISGDLGNNISTLPWYVATGPTTDNIRDYYPEDARIFVGTTAELGAFLRSASIQQIGNVQVITGTMVLSSENPQYEEGDSIVIIGDNPQYQVIQWNGEVTVSNLPAIVSTGSVSNPGLVELWRPISGFVTSMRESMEMVIGIVYEFPEEVVTPIYVVCGAIILLGMIKIMREH